MIGRDMAAVFAKDTQYKILKVEKSPAETCGVVRILRDAYNKGHFLLDAKDAWHWRDVTNGQMLFKLLPEEVGQLMGGN